MSNNIKEKLGVIGENTALVTRNAGHALGSVLALTLATLSGITIAMQLANAIFPKLSIPQTNINPLMLIIVFTAACGAFAGLVANNNLLNSADKYKGGLAGVIASPKIYQAFNQPREASHD